MKSPNNIVEYHNAGCQFFYNKDTSVLRIIGAATTARITVLQLIREQWLPTDLRAICVTNGDDPVMLITGVSLTVYIAAKPAKTKPSPRSFKDMVGK